MKIMKELTPLQTLKLIDTLIRRAAACGNTVLQAKLINTEITYARSCIALGKLKDPSARKANQL